MKKRIFAAVIASILLTVLTLSAMSATGVKTVELWYNDIKITLDGEEIVPKDATGNTVAPFIIDGTTYLPVRAVAQAVSLDVEWDEDTNTVKLTGTPDADDPPVYNWDNPAPLGIPLTLSTYGEYGRVAQVKVIEITRGEEAFEILREQSSDQVKPDAGKEYLLVYVSIIILAKDNPSESEYIANTTNIYGFDAYGPDGDKYEKDRSAMRPDQRLEGFFAGGEKEIEGYLIFLVPKNDPAPRLLYGPGKDYTGGLWFSLAES